MTESKAAEKFQAFDSLRNRFGGAIKSPETDSHSQSHQWRDKTRRSSRANLPPLVPLIEEGDQIQEQVYHESRYVTQLHFQGTPVRGKWKYSRYNHLTGPAELDSLETDSVSSAYSSKSDSLSPTFGSVSELSDSGSHDSGLEYDVKKHRARRSSESRLATLRATFEHQNTQMSGYTKYGHHHLDIPSEFVPTRTKAWNEAIGSWIFQGVPQVQSPMDSPHVERMRRPSNEVRMPTPLSTPLFGSLENLADSGSKISLLSHESEDSNLSWDPEAKYKLGKFLNEGKHQLSTSSMCPQKAPESPKEIKSDFSKAKTLVSVLISPEEQTEEIKSAVSPMSTKWDEAYRKYQTLREKANEEDSTEDAIKSERLQKQSAEEPTRSSIVEQRAKRFGGTKSGLRRAQSVRIRSQNSPRNTKRSRPKQLSTSFC